jgi:4-amino-4-deoxy-L-arabinose transferase-like glycosyltransferase
LITLFEKEATLKYLLLVGIALRVFLYVTLPPFGVDAHAEVINFLIEKGRLPLTREVFCAMHPPLYYLMAAPFFLFDTLASQKVTQVLSLFLSVANLYVLYLLCKEVLTDVLSRNVSFLLAVFLHSFVTFSLYVSNDTLAYFIGSLLFLLLHRYIKKPTQSNELILAIVLGLGLLTKGTFLAFGPPLAAVVLLMLWKKEASVQLIIFRLFVFGAIALAIGSYKYIENYYAEGRFIAHNLDFFQYMPAETYIGKKSIYYFDLKRLVSNPTFFEGDPLLEHIYPVIFYATFWYKFMEPFNGFELGSRTSFKYIGSALYLIGMIPSLLILVGLFQKSFSAVRFAFKFWKYNSALFVKRLEEVCWLVTLLLSVLLVIIAGLKYNVWVCFQSRLFLHAFFPILWLLYLGLVSIRKLGKGVFLIGFVSMLAVSLLFLTYYLTEGIHLLTLPR